MPASYRSYCTEAAARFDDSKTKLAKESKCREEFLSKFSKNGSGKQMHTSSKGFLAPSGKLQRMVDAGVGGKGPFRAELMWGFQCQPWEHNVSNAVAWGKPQGLCCECKQDSADCHTNQSMVSSGLFIWGQGCPTVVHGISAEMCLPWRIFILMLWDIPGLEKFCMLADVKKMSTVLAKTQVFSLGAELNPNKNILWKVTKAVLGFYVCLKVLTYKWVLICLSKIRFLKLSSEVIDLPALSLKQNWIWHLLIVVNCSWLATMHDWYWFCGNKTNNDFGFRSRERFIFSSITIVFFKRIYPGL